MGSPMTPLNVLVILGSVRRGRMSERVATFVMSRLAATEGVTAELIDLRDLDLPIMEERLGRIEPTPAHVAELGAKIEQADGLIIVSPEYNHGYPGVLKNALDYFYAQYNVLRILRGAGPAGATCSDVAGSLIQHDPDVTRLLDRLDTRGLIERGRDAKDRRIVRTKITKAGAALLAELDEPVAALHARQLGHVSDKRLDDLVALLGEARTGNP